MSFGKNRVQYNEFVWSYYRHDLFDVYFNEDGINLANYTADYAYKAIAENEDFFDYKSYRFGPNVTYMFELIPLTANFSVSYY